MASSYLKLNPAKTELMLISFRTDNSPNPLDYSDPLTLCDEEGPLSATIFPSQTAKNLGVVFDEKLTMKEHVSKVVKECNYNLVNLRRIGTKL